MRKCGHAIDALLRVRGRAERVEGSREAQGEGEEVGVGGRLGREERAWRLGLGEGWEGRNATGWGGSIVPAEARRGWGGRRAEKKDR